MLDPDQSQFKHVFDGTTVAAGALTSHSSKAGVNMKRVPVSAQTVQGRLWPQEEHELFKSIFNSWTSELLTHRCRIKLNYHEGKKNIKIRMPLKWHSCSLLNWSRDLHVLSKAFQRHKIKCPIFTPIISQANLFCSRPHTDTLTWSLVVQSVTTASGARFGGGRGAWWRSSTNKSNQTLRQTGPKIPCMLMLSVWWLKGGVHTLAFTEVLLPPNPPAPTTNTENWL